MSGQVGNNILRTSGVVAATAAGLNWVSTVVTASTLTAEAGNGYFINTTSNTCTITLPASAEAGDQIVLMDYVRTWGTNKIIIDSNGLNYQGESDVFIVEYDTSGETVNIVYSGATQGWIPLDDDVVADAPVPPPTQKAIFAFGTTGSNTNVSNLVNSSGVVATDTTGVGTARNGLAATGYGTDKAIFAYGSDGSGGNFSMSNLVSNSGVVATDVSGVGTAREALAGAEYGSTGLALFAFGGAYLNVRNLVNSSGVIAADATGAGTARNGIAATGYGVGLAIFGYGYQGGGTYNAQTNLVTNVGVVGADVSGVGTTRANLGAARYGTDKAIFGFGNGGGGATGVTNLVSNVGVVSSDVSGVGTTRTGVRAAAYGGDKAIFAYGNTGSPTAVSNLVSSSGVVASDVTGVGTARGYPAAAGYSISA